MDDDGTDWTKVPLPPPELRPGYLTRPLDIVADPRMPPDVLRIGDRWFRNNGADGAEEIDRPGWWEST